MDGIINKKKKILILLISLIVGISFSFTIGTENTYAASKPSKVTISSIGSADYNAIKVTWKTAKNAKKYQVYRATSKNGKYKLVKTTTSKSFTNTGLTTGKTYYYKVRGVNGSKKGTFSTKKYAKPALKKTTGAAAKASSYNSIKISWSKVNGAKGYQVYRATSKSGTYSKIKTTTSTSYTNTSLIVGKTYYYKVRAYRVVNGSTKYGSYSSIVNTKTSLGVPQEVTASLGDESITVSWNAVKGATKYVIERSDGETFTTKELSYEDTSVESGTTYMYRVRAYNNVYSSYSEYSDEVEFVVDPSRPQFTVSEDVVFEYKGISIYLGQEWTDEIESAFKENTTGFYKTLRPMYAYDFKNKLHDTTVYMFNIRDYSSSEVVHNYDEFIQIMVSEGRIISWETACDNMGSACGKELHKGDVADSTNLPKGVYIQSNIYATNLYNGYRELEGRSTYDTNAVLTGGFAGFKTFDITAITKSQKYMDAEKTIGFHWINVLRVGYGSQPLKYLKAFECSTFTGTLEDGTVYENQLCGAQAKVDTIAESKSKDLSVKVTHETVNYLYGPLAGVLSAYNREMCLELTGISAPGENLASSGSGESCVEMYLNSSLHIAALLQGEFTHIGLGIAPGWNVEMFGMDVFNVGTDDVIDYSN